MIIFRRLATQAFRLPGVVGVILATSLSVSVSAQTFKIATISPDGTAWMQAIRAGAQRIEEKTQGRVKMKFYTGGVMGSGNTLLRKIRIGQLQGGAFTSSELSDVYNGTQIYSLPFLFRDYKEVDQLRNQIDSAIKAGLDANGMTALGIGEGGFAYVMSQIPVRSLEDALKQKNWLPEGDSISQRLYETMKISPVSLSLADVYTGLQTGLIESVAATPVGAIAFQWHTKVKYLTDIPLLYITGFLVVDKNAFSKESPADQEVILAEMNTAFKQINQGGREDNLNARKALKQQGVDFIAITPAERKRWDDIANRTNDALVKMHDIPTDLYKTVQTDLQKIRNGH